MTSLTTHLLQKFTDPTAEVRNKPTFANISKDDYSKYIAARITLGVCYTLAILTLGLAIATAVGVFSFVAIPLLAATGLAILVVSFYLLGIAIADIFISNINLNS